MIAPVGRLRARAARGLRVAFAATGSTPRPPAAPKMPNAPARTVRHLVAVVYRQAGLIALCALLGTAASLVLYIGPQRIYPATAKVRVQTGQQNRRLAEASSPVIETQLAQAKEDLRQSQDRIVALLVQDSEPSRRGADDTGAVAAQGLKLELNPDVAVAGAGALPLGAALKAQALEPQLRLDEARQPHADDAENVLDLRSQAAGSQPRFAGTVHENTPLGAELNRLERARQFAQQRCVALQRKRDQIGLDMRHDASGSERRAIIDAPDPLTVAEGEKKKVVAMRGPVAGLMLGLLLAALRELGGDRMRSSREAEWALGAPVLGAIPTLSAKARNSYFGTSTAALESAPKALA